MNTKCVEVKECVKSDSTLGSGTHSVRCRECTGRYVEVVYGSRVVVETYSLHVTDLILEKFSPKKKK